MRFSTKPSDPSHSDQWVIGWREWVSLPDLGIRHLKAKIDTGARSSSLHAINIETFERDEVAMVRFFVHPIQRWDVDVVPCESRVHDIRRVRSSTGVSKKRIVIVTNVHWLETTWQVELTLADRTRMGFRMLIGREAVRGRMLVDPGRSYFGGRPRKKKKK